MDLDDPRSFRRLDRSGMAARIAGLPDQCLEAWRAGLDLDLGALGCAPERLVVLGTGGSAAGADLLAGLQACEGGAPVVVHRDYALPAIADGRALVVASSHSGATEEVLDAFGEALRRGRACLAITGGGPLAALAQQHGVPTLRVPWDGPPRTALGYSLFPLLALVQRLGLGPDRSAEVAEAVAAMRELGARLAPAVPTRDNPAKGLALALDGRIAVVYGAEHLAAAARRWRAQIAENAESWAFAEALPELHHHAIQGLRLPGDAPHRLAVVLLRAAAYGPRTRRRCALTEEALARAAVPCHPVDAPGPSRLTQAMTAVLLGDYASYYLAVRRGVDPTPVPTVDWIKARLAGD